MGEALFWVGAWHIIASCWVLSIALMILLIVAKWKIYEKAGEEGWKSIIPFYSDYILYKIVWGNGWLFLLLCIPFVNVAINILCMMKLAKAFGQSGAFAVGLIFLPNIFLLILGFGDYTYLGPQQCSV